MISQVPEWRAFVAIFLIFLVSRCALIAVGAATVVAHGDPFDSAADIVALFDRWDSAWYFSVADHGYSIRESPEQPGATNYAFSPAFPLLVSATKILTGLSTPAAGFIVANLVFLAALGFVYVYARHTGLATRAALLAVTLLAVTPQSFIFSAGYSESLFLLLLAAAMYFLHQERFWLSALAAAFLSAARPNGISFVAFAASHHLQDARADAFQFWKRPERYLPGVLAPAGLFAFWWWSFLTTGDAFASSTTQFQGWGRTFDWPWFNLYVHLLDGGFLGRYWVISSLSFFACSLLLLKHGRTDEFIFCLFSFILYWSLATIPASLVRWAIVLFPVYIGLACELKGKPRMTAVVVIAFGVWNAFLMSRWTMRDAIVN